MLVLIKIAFICYAAYWAWNKAFNKRDVFQEAISSSVSGVARASVAALQVEVISTLLGNGNDDGDVPCKVRVKIKNTTDYDLSRVSLTTLIKTDSGVLLIASQDDEHDEIKSGGTRTITIDVGYLKFQNTLWGVNTTVRALGFGARAGALQEIQLPKTFEGPFMAVDSLAIAPEVTLRSVSGSVKRSDDDDETSEGTLSLRGIVAVAQGASVYGLEIKSSLKSSGGRHLSEDSTCLDAIALDGQPITWSLDVDNIARLSGATLEFTSSLLATVAEGEGLGEGYEDDYSELDSSADDDNKDECNDEDEDEALEDDDVSDADEVYDNEEDTDFDSDDEPDDESKVALFALQIQSVQSFSFASRGDSPKPASIEAIRADFERIELTLYPELPCQCSVDGLTVRDVQVMEDRVERRYEAEIKISATETEYEKVKALLSDEGFLRAGVADWTNAIASFIWDTNKAPDYADFSGEQRNISLVTAWDLEVDGEEKKPQIEFESRKIGKREQGNPLSRRSSVRAEKGTSKSVDITAFVRSVQRFSFRDDGSGGLPIRARVERDFKEITCDLDPKPPGICELTDLEVEDVNVSKNGVTRVFTCVVHVSASGDELKALQKLMAEEHYMDGGEINWSAAINAFLSECYECPDYACFTEERVTVDTTEAELDWTEASSQGA
jgi:hypothetical protein